MFSNRQRGTLTQHLLPVTLTALVLLCTVNSSLAADSRPNILLISLDDQNDWVAPLQGHPLVLTPHMDRLAARGLTFTNAHCQAPLCNPSRTSMLIGLRPSSTGIYGLSPWFRSAPRLSELVTLPELFRRHGYGTLAIGKIYHSGYPPKHDVPREFSVYGIPAAASLRPPAPFTTTPARHPAMDWGPFPEADEQHPDAKIADWAIEQLRNKPPEPFFLCVGFQLPHVPCYAPSKWFDLYPDDDSILPAVNPTDRNDTPEFSWYLHWKLPEPRLSWLQSTQQWRPLVRAYLASTSFVDSQVGRVLDCLAAEHLQENTIVVLWSDHGWHLGEKGITGKNSLWERSTRVPLILAGPGITAGGCSTRPVELLDIYPTLADLCGLELPNHVEGHSLKPLLVDPNSPRESPAITTHNPGNHAVRSERWRYIHYANGTEELYDLIDDPQEWNNLIDQPELAAVVDEHRRWLPAHDAPPAAGSAHRILIYNSDTDEAMWEGEPVLPAEKEE